MADSKKTKRSASERTTNTAKRPSRAHLQAALEEIYAAHGEDELGVRQAVGQVMSPVGDSGRPAGLRWYAPLSLDKDVLGEWARSTAVAFIGNAELTQAHRQALLGWRGLVEILPNRELGVVKTSRGPVRTIASLQQLLDEEEAVVGRLVGGPVREAFEALERRKAWAQKEAREAEAAAAAEAKAAAEAAQLEQEEAEGIQSLMAQARAQLENLQRRAELGRILASYEAEIEAAKKVLAQRRKGAEAKAAKAADSNRKLLASAGLGKVREALQAGNEALAVAWASYAGAKTETRRAGALEALMRLDTRLQSEAIAPSALDRALRGDCRELLDQEVRDAALVEFATLSADASTIPAMRKAGESVPGFIAPAKGAKKAKVEAALNWFARLHQELVEADL